MKYHGGTPLALGTTRSGPLADCDVVPFSDVVVELLVKDVDSFSSGMVANCFNTCFSARRRIGLLRK